MKTVTVGNLCLLILHREKTCYTEDSCTVLGRNKVVWNSVSNSKWVKRSIKMPSSQSGEMYQILICCPSSKPRNLQTLFVLCRMGFLVRLGQQEVLQGFTRLAEEGISFIESALSLQKQLDSATPWTGAGQVPMSTNSQSLLKLP